MAERGDPYQDGVRLDRRDLAPLAAGWCFALPIAVRFRDLDAVGHANNAVYLTYCEQGRVAYLAAVCATGPKEISTILARVEIDYRRPVVLGDRLRVLVRAREIGTKSFTLEYRLLVTADGVEQIACESISVLVYFDYGRHQSLPLPPALIAALEQFEGRSLRRRVPC